ncbi:MAG: hypothetical protein A2079_07325 [Geobacteraceae bacterium GWC2_48_7]|nr:MAG: hypothetical protein A2079_07325 [Geobacteraceae bacterium GWC2_48_7]
MAASLVVVNLLVEAVDLVIEMVADHLCIQLFVMNAALIAKFHSDQLATDQFIAVLVLKNKMVAAAVHLLAETTEAIDVNDLVSATDLAKTDQCTTQFAAFAVRPAKFHLDQQLVNQFHVAIASRNQVLVADETLRKSWNNLWL